MNYQDKVTIITGGAQGIGAGCVRAFAAAGARVVFADRQPEPSEALIKEIQATTPRYAVQFVQTEMTDAAQVRRLIESTISRHGQLDCLINNAGIHPPYHPIDEFSLDDLRAVLELNVVSVYAACQAALPHLRRTHGNIINIASLVATLGQFHATTYVASKGAVLALTKALAIDEAPHGVRVNSVSPGNIWTPLWEAGANESSDPAATITKGEKAQLLARMGTATEAGRLCLFLAAEASFTTGVDHLLTGGAELDYGQKAR